MRRRSQLFRVTFAVLLSLVMVFSPFTSLAADLNQSEDNSDLPNVNVRVESLDYTITEPTDIQTDTFDVGPYADGGEVLPDTPRAIHAIIRALEESGIDTFDKNEFDLGWGGNYIHGIDGLSEFDAGMLSGWMYYVDNQYAPVGVLDFDLEEGQDIVVFYVQNYMENVFSFFEQENYVSTENEPIKLHLKGVFSDQSTGETDNVVVDDATILVNDEPFEVDGELVKTDEEGKAELTFAEPGTYHVSATKKNSENEQIISRPYARVVIEEIPDVVPPVISVEGLKDGMVVNEEKISFSVKAIDDLDGEVEASVSLNNEELSSEDGRYEASLLLGENNITVSAVDSSDNEAVKNYTVIYEEETLNEPVEVAEAIDLAGDYILINGVYSEWEAIGLAQAGKEIHVDYYDVFLQNVESQITNGLENGRIKITDIERLAMAAAVIGEDATDLLDHNLIELIYNSPDHASGEDTMTFQGNNGPIFALIALDSLDYDVPEDARWTRQELIEELLSTQNEDGSWHLSDLFESPSIDITAMAMIALSQYKDQPEVDAALEKTVAYLSDMQTDEGGFDGGSFVGGITSEAAAQVIIGLTAYGVDPTGPLFTKDQNVIEHLLSFQNSEDGGFFHTHGDSNSNSMATEQALQGLVAYDYFTSEKGSLYDFTGQTYPILNPDHEDEDEGEGNEGDEGNEDEDGSDDEGKEDEDESDHEDHEDGNKDDGNDKANENEFESDNEDEDASDKDEEESTVTGDKNDGNESGKDLPKTATNMYNYAAIGLLLLALGGLIIYRYRKSLFS